MSVFIIDPAEQTITAVELPTLSSTEFLEVVRSHIGVPQLAVLPVATGHFAVWCDSMGMLKPGRAFWRFADDDYRFAGKCLLTAIHPQNGMPSSFPPSHTVDGLRQNVVFHPSDDLVKIHEEVVGIPDHNGKIVPAIKRQSEWRTQVEPAIPPPPPGAEDEIGSGWTISEREDGTYKAERYALQDDALRLVAMLSAPNLEDLRAQLPPGLVRIEPDEREENVVEHWMVPIPEEES